jgi:hypothetical protein
VSYNRRNTHIHTVCVCVCARVCVCTGAHAYVCVHAWVCNGHILTTDTWLANASRYIILNSWLVRPCPWTWNHLSHWDMLGNRNSMLPGVFSDIPRPNQHFVPLHWCLRTKLWDSCHSLTDNRYLHGNSQETRNAIHVAYLTTTNTSSLNVEQSNLSSKTYIPH